MKRTLQGCLIHMSYLSVTMTHLGTIFTDTRSQITVKKLVKKFQAAVILFG